MLSFQICAFSFCFFLFYWKVSKEGTLVWCIYTYFARSTLIYFRWFARRLILEICFPIYFWSSGEVVGWDLKTPSKNSAKPRRECLCEPGSSPKELPGRNRYFSPSRYKVRYGDQVYAVWSCLLLLMCACHLVGGLFGLCQLSCFGTKKFTLLLDSCDLLLCVLRIRVDFWLFSLFNWHSAEKVCLWAVPLFGREEKKRKLKQPLYNLKLISDLHSAVDTY